MIEHKLLRDRTKPNRMDYQGSTVLVKESSLVNLNRIFVKELFADMSPSLLLCYE